MFFWPRDGCAKTSWAAHDEIPMEFCHGDLRGTTAKSPGCCGGVASVASDAPGGGISHWMSQGSQGARAGWKPGDWVKVPIFRATLWYGNYEVEYFNNYIYIYYMLCSHVLFYVPALHWFVDRTTQVTVVGPPYLFESASVTGTCPDAATSQYLDRWGPRLLKCDQSLAIWGCLSKWGTSPNRHWNRDNDHQPIDLGLPCFQTNLFLDSKTSGRLEFFSGYRAFFCKKHE